MGKILRRGAIALAASLVLLSGAALAEVWSVTQFWDNVGTNTSTWIPTAHGNELQVTIDPNGVQDGTVTVYTCAKQDSNTCVSVGTVAGLSSTTVTFVGTSTPFLYVTLTGNTPATGSIDAILVVKK